MHEGMTPFDSTNRILQHLVQIQPQISPKVEPFTPIIRSRVKLAGLYMPQQCDTVTGENGKICGLDSQGTLSIMTNLIYTGR